MSATRQTPRYLRPIITLVTVFILLGIAVFGREYRQAFSAELSPIETRVLGQSRWLSGGVASLRVIVSDHRTGAPVRAQVVIGLKAPQKTHKLFGGNTTSQGTIDAQFTVPEIEPGNYQLLITVNSPLGLDEVTQQIRIEESAQLMLTCDKPLYQPGQTMHIRVLAMNLATRCAIVRQPITFEIEDARGNKVFKKKTELSDFGTAAVDFDLAQEVNMGTFTLRALLPEGQVEKKVRVERYVLPKFKVSLTTQKPYYLPGETVTGTVQADYFFGKPVVNGTVVIDVSTMDIGVTQLAELNGQTDANGFYSFEYTLPDHFVGQPFEQGRGMAEFHASVTDTAQHTQETFTARPVVKDPILLAIVPENRSLIPGINNHVYIAAASPDGQPLKGATITVEAKGIGGKTVTLTTDALGLTTYDFVPKKGSVTLQVSAKTSDGKSATTEQTLESSPAEESILLRTSQVIARVGDRVKVATIATNKRGTIYLDILRNKQTILTKALVSNNGQASIMLPITDDMVGTLELHAYKILPNEDIIRDTQLMVVQPANDLVIGVEMDKKEYRPGEDAEITFQVKDQQQRPVLAALGLAIVDESVFALSEMQPGLEKIYFMLERELLEPRYEVHGLKPVDLILDTENPVRPMAEEARQRAAQMLFAAAPQQNDFDIRVNTYQQRWEKVKQQAVEELQKSQEKIQTALIKYHEKTGVSLTTEQSLFHLVDTGFLKIGDLQDRWGHFFRSDLQGAANYDGWFTLKSAGPDGRWNTVDDLDVSPMLQGRWGMKGARGMGGAVMEDMAFDGAIMLKAGAMPMVVTATNMAQPTSGTGGNEPVRIREYFPETMYWNPLIITDRQGRAEIRIPVADSITTWRMSMLANTALGQLGSASVPLRVFQDFFVDIDLPVALTQNDSVSIPIAVYNYLPGPQDVTLRMEIEPWFDLQGAPEQQVHLAKDEVKVVYFPITVREIGHHPLTVHADGTQLSDAIRRFIDVLPDGKEFRETINDRLEGKIEQTVTIPESAIDGASAVWLKLYPGAFSQVVEGLDGMLRMPNGCFEQTSSTTYPNILVLDYLKATKKINPELQMKAEQYINVGYQRLVTFECKNGGFSWFGDEPAHLILTAYGLLEFSDMARVHEVDPALIARTQQWLAGMQKADGTWEVKEGGIAEGIINRQTGALRSTAYIAWTLAESGFRGAQLQRAVQYIKAHRNETKDPYTLAVILNLLTAVERDGNVTGEVAQALIDQAKTTEKAAYWEGDTKTFTGATKDSADLETTGLAAYGLVKWGRNGAFTNKVLTHLVQSKDSFGTWSSTQGTVWSLKALLLASSNATGGGKGKITVLANGQTAATINITEEDSDVMRQIDLSGWIKEGKNQISLQYAGEGAPLYQIVTRYYLPWSEVRLRPEGIAPLSIDVKYDKTTLAQDDTATVTVTVKNETRKIAEMPLIDLGVPPGFSVDASELEAAVAAKRISKYTQAARQIIIYLEKLDPGQSVMLTYRLKAKYPIKARSPQSTVYPYYNPDQMSVSAPQEVIISK